MADPFPEPFPPPSDGDPMASPLPPPSVNSIHGLVRVIGDAIHAAGCRDFRMLESYDEDPGVAYFGFYTPDNIDVSGSLSYTV